ncbi:hypothetical protein HanXRQr2_Chr17g0803861 [Helianthus annuus]|uniref:Cotton fiber protein n=1 Tax=Helianthus annuus TaxID=4232 RepID=A0A9K3DHM2_HELAN|nr:uncharacterized protein LOC110925706 [Helianthus annuus]KAF5755534.1 hypothetical protein HanXRQr2_Chr17g0803861 [Helianthus annuus]KAJ0429245.1 hypothetical protein HanHA300_Chr17g0655121 [Helianthus annuus]KAJ0813266.1 hypothetical protein HanPSC8_Chr17g0771451 [Helianthus annuus]
MGKKRSLMLQKASNLIKISIFIAKMRLIHLKKSTKFTYLKHLNRYNSYGFLQERQFSPSSTPLISFHRRKANGSSFYSICFLSCFNGPRHGVALDENYSIETAIVEVERDGLELSYGVDEEEEDSVDERAEKFIERFYEEMKRQRRESLSSAPNLPFNKMLKY